MRHVVDGKTVKAKSPADVLKPGDVIFVQKNDGTDNAYSLRQVPEVEGGLIAMDPHTGRVLAMVGGFSYAQSRIQPRHAGHAPAGLVVQADRLFGGARQWLYAGLGDHGRADHHPERQHDLDAEEL